MCDVKFFKTDTSGGLIQLAKMATSDDIMAASSATLNLDNQKNVLKGVCIHHETNGDQFHCPVQALGRRILHLRMARVD